MADALAIPLTVHHPVTIRLNDFFADEANEPAMETAPSNNKAAIRRRKARLAKRAGKLDCIAVAAEIKRQSCKANSLALFCTSVGGG